MEATNLHQCLRLRTRVTEMHLNEDEGTWNVTLVTRPGEDDLDPYDEEDVKKNKI